ncbi:MAG: terpene cyclase/mutase family protein [Planctomycetes bacterium]|nr:terpene cyclase/mutase family protein [Planctomycetota bacterium]MCB9868809.1 terpene cyclase/mutase family protein [Planctomycetota bacterium]
MSILRATATRAASGALLLACIPTLAFAQAAATQGGAPAAAKPSPLATLQRGIDFLLKNQEDGRFFMSMPGRRGGAPRKHFDAGLTGLALAAVQSKPHASRTPAEQKVIDQGIAWLLEQQSRAGSFGQRTVVYATSSAVFALAKARDGATKELDAKLKSALDRAGRFLKAVQNTEENKHAPSDVDYGGFGYGNRERADLSNTNFAIDALRKAGMSKDDEALAKALVFLQRVQNLREVNKLTQETKDRSGKAIKMVSGDDGGATYYPGTSPAGTLEMVNGSRSPKSYGSMTYALLKTYTLCGVGRDDQRVQAAIRWVAKHWTVDENPGFDKSLGEAARYQGLFYYYMVMSQALKTAGIEQLEVPASGAKPAQKIDWRNELAAKLKELQAANGSWCNKRSDRWYEGLDVIASAYAMLALDSCIAK